MKHPNTKKQLAMLCMAIVVFVAIECLCSCYYPKLFTYVFLSGLIWLMLLVAWFMDIMGKWYIYNEFKNKIR